MYKVEFETLAILPDNKIGNIYQGKDVCYVDCNIAEIEERLNKFLITKKRKSVIKSVKKIEGFILNND